MSHTEISKLAPGYSRLATKTDLELLVQFINKTFVHDNYFKHTERTNWDDVAAYLEKGNFLLLEEHDELIGLIYVELRESGHAYIGLLAINPEKQNRGIGRQLLQTAEDFCRSNGRDIADADVISLRPDLIERYQRMGYRIIGEAPYHRPEILVQPCHFVVIQKDLSEVEA